MPAAKKWDAPPGSSVKPRKKQQQQQQQPQQTTPASEEDESLPTLKAACQLNETGKKTHLQALKMREMYACHVKLAQTWLRSHFNADRILSISSHPEEGVEIYHDPAFKDAFKQHPNHCSNEALAIYLGWKGFLDDLSGQSTIDGIRAAFKRLWDEASVLFLTHGY